MLPYATAIRPEEARRELKARAGIERCLRVLARLHPGVSTGKLSQRCTEDLRLRLKGVRVCRTCAREIADASGTYQVRSPNPPWSF